MGWNSPAMDVANANYYFYFQHTNGKTLTLTVTGAAYLEDPELYEAAFEAAASVLDASSNFTLVSASRLTPSNETYTL